MRILVVDITGSVTNYCSYLCEALTKQLEKGDDLLFSGPLPFLNNTCKNRKLFNFGASKYKGVLKWWQRKLKILEGVLNYLYVLHIVKKVKPDIIHFQSLPLLEYNNSDAFFLKKIRRGGKRKLLYTHHSLYPHNIEEGNKEVYRKRFLKAFEQLNAIIVHTKYDERTLVDEFCIPLAKIRIISQGMFEPKGYLRTTVNRNDGQTRFLMFGIQSEYKGTDIFIEAIACIPEEKRKEMSFRIVGKTDSLFFDKYQDKASILGIEWVPRAVSDETLYSEIIAADVIVFPYREISLSGALLLAIFFNKRIIPSDIPSFRETLVGFKPGWFFESENAQSMADLMIRHLDKQVFYSEIEIIRSLKKSYSWEKTSHNTLTAYMM